MGGRRRSRKWCSVVCLGIALLALSVDSIRAATVVQLTWDANTEPDLAGYRIRYGVAPSTPTQMIDVGLVTSYSIMNLTAGTTYYFVVTAYDQAGNESQRSNEVAAQPAQVGPVLTIAATDAPDPVAAGGNLTYTLSYSNTGSANATGVVIADTVPVNTTFVSATGGGTLSGGVVTWSPGNLAAGASGSVQMVVR
ncbi:MAG TPA: fibronectin type III domain-containing protein, partial [Candidatus Polarisedimenticolia bacterium]|nr:fibronectin type III domain-containing protein [Candidatus Polarisedimenticolia bacterium]